MIAWQSPELSRQDQLAEISEELYGVLETPDGEEIEQLTTLASQRPTLLM